MSAHLCRAVFAACLICRVTPHALSFLLHAAGSREWLMVLSKPSVGSLAMGNCCRGSRSEAGWKKTPLCLLFSFQTPHSLGIHNSIIISFRAKGVRMSDTWECQGVNFICCDAVEWLQRWSVTAIMCLLLLALLPQCFFLPTSPGWDHCAVGVEQTHLG